MGQVYQFSMSTHAMVPIETDSLRIGQKVMQAHKYETGVVCEKGGPYSHGYTVIFEDGDESTGQQLDALSPYTRISLVEGFVGADEVNRLIQLRDAKRITDKWEREEAARLKDEQVVQLTAKLRAKCPWATTNNASKNLKAELKQTWPSVKFSVTRRHHSSLDITWTDGPTDKQVNEVAGKYEDGSFNGMEDIHEYDHSAYGEAIDIVLGRATYVFTHRESSDALIQKALDRVVTKFQRNIEVHCITAEITVEQYRKGNLWNASPYLNGNAVHDSFQTLINEELAKIGMMPVQKEIQ